MSQIEQKLTELGISLPPAPTPVASYVPFQRSGEQLWISGQIAVSQGKLIYEGKVGAEISLDQAKACARQCAINLMAQVKSALGGQLDQVKQVLKLHVFVACTPDFTSQHLIANEASELLFAVFGEKGKHARSAVGVSALPLNSPVEIDAIFLVTDTAEL
jgi:enamine deaminase RidA (YjgF/YER057c/UK114 family)